VVECKPLPAGTPAWGAERATMGSRGAGDGGAGSAGADGSPPPSLAEQLAVLGARRQTHGGDEGEGDRAREETEATRHGRGRRQIDWRRSATVRTVQGALQRLGALRGTDDVKPLAPPQPPVESCLGAGPVTEAYSGNPVSMSRARAPQWINAHRDHAREAATVGRCRLTL